MGFFRGLRLSLGHLANKSLKALCLSSKMVYQHLLYLLSLWTYWHLKFTKSPIHFFNGNFRGCWMADFTSGLQWAETAVWQWHCLLYCLFVTLLIVCVFLRQEYVLEKGHQLQCTATWASRSLRSILSFATQMITFNSANFKHSKRNFLLNILKAAF